MMIIQYITKATKTQLTVRAWVLGVGFWIFANTTTVLSQYPFPFCRETGSQTLRQEMLTMDAVAIGKLETNGPADIEGTATFIVEKVLSGEKVIKVNQAIEASYSGPGKSSKKFLLFGVDPTKMLWSSQLPLSADEEKYVEAIRRLPESTVERLDFFQRYFEHTDLLIARDSYHEFAMASYADILLLKDKMNREQLLQWVRDTSKMNTRKGLYFAMLAICGKPEDAVLFESMIRSENPDARSGLSGLFAAYLSVKGKKGIEFVKEEVFDNAKSKYGDIYSAVEALRFHDTEANILPRDSITGAMHRLLERPDCADLVIPDLTRWSDWSQIDKVCELFEKVTDDNNWLRVPIINYLQACPLPEAKEKLIHLGKIDPKSVKRAKRLFPIPSPAAPHDSGVTSK